MLNEVWSENFTLFCRASDMINVSSKTPFWYQHSEREREKEGRWILGITNTCIYLSCCWTIKCAPKNKNKHREYSLVLYCMEILDFRTLYLLVTWSFLCMLILQYGRRMICFKLNNKFSRPSCSYFFWCWIWLL